MPSKSMAPEPLEPGGSSLHLTSEQLSSLGLADLLPSDSKTITLTATDVGDDGVTFDAEIESPEEDATEPEEETPEPATKPPSKSRILSPRDMKGASSDFYGE